MRTITVPRTSLPTALRPGDRIVAFDGRPPARRAIVVTDVHMTLVDHVPTFAFPAGRLAIGDVVQHGVTVERHTPWSRRAAQVGSAVALALALLTTTVHLAHSQPATGTSVAVEGEAVTR